MYVDRGAWGTRLINFEMFESIKNSNIFKTRIILGAQGMRSVLSEHRASFTHTVLTIAQLVMYDQRPFRFSKPSWRCTLHDDVDISFFYIHRLNAVKPEGAETAAITDGQKLNK